MAKLNKRDKQELLAIAQSSAIKKDFENIRKNHFLFLKKTDKPDLDVYMEFLSFADAFANHPRKPFRRIEGNNFKM